MDDTTFNQVLIFFQAFDPAGSQNLINAFGNRPFSKMAAENSNRSILKTYTSTRKKTFTLVTLPSFSISGVISAEKM